MNDVNNKKLKTKKEDVSILEILEMEIKIYNLRLEVLNLQKPYWFQKEKLNIYEEKKEFLERKLSELKELKKTIN